MAIKKVNLLLFSAELKKTFEKPILRGVIFEFGL